MRYKLPAAAAALACATTVAVAAPALGDPHGQPNQHAIDAHLLHQLKKAAKAGDAVLDTGTRIDGGSVGAPVGSYTLTSSTYKMGKFGDSSKVLATCGSGYYVDYDPNDDVDPMWGYTLNVDVHSSSDFVGAATGYPQAWSQVGTSSTGVPVFQGFSMKLSNDNPFASNTGSFSWTCDPLPASST
jgi:hypothetical protein